MTTDLALEYIKRRACDLCYGNDYTIRLRHFVLQPLETRQVNAYNQLFILVKPYSGLRIEGAVALFDLSEDKTNELQYEFSGDMQLINQTIFVNHALFIQVIPKFCESPCP